MPDATELALGILLIAFGDVAFMWQITPESPTSAAIPLKGSLTSQGTPCTIASTLAVGSRG